MSKSVIDCQYIAEQLEVISQANQAGSREVVETVVGYLKRHLGVSGKPEKQSAEIVHVQSVIPLGHAAHSTRHWRKLTEFWITSHGVGETVTSDACIKWIEAQHKDTLTGGDLARLSKKKVTWKVRLSNAFQLLKADGVLANQPNTRAYRILRLP